MFTNEESLRRVIRTAMIVLLILALLEWIPIRSFLAWLDLTLVGQVLATASLLELIYAAAAHRNPSVVVGWMAAFLASLLLGGSFFAEYSPAVAIALGLLGSSALIAPAIAQRHQTAPVEVQTVESVG